MSHYRRDLDVAPIRIDVYPKPRRVDNASLLTSAEADRRFRVWPEARYCDFFYAAAREATPAAMARDDETDRPSARAHSAVAPPRNHLTVDFVSTGM